MVDTAPPGTPGSGLRAPSCARRVDAETVAEAIAPARRRGALAYALRPEGALWRTLDDPLVAAKVIALLQRRGFT